MCPSSSFISIDVVLTWKYSTLQISPRIQLTYDELCADRVVWVWTVFVMTGPAAGCWELHLMTLTWAKYFCFTCLGFFFYISYMWHQRWCYWIHLFFRVYYRSQVTFISIIVLIWCLSVIRSKLILIGFNTFTV